MSTEPKEEEKIPTPNWIRLMESGSCRDVYSDGVPTFTMLSKSPDDPVHFIIELAGQKCEFHADHVYSGKPFYSGIIIEHAGYDTTYSILGYEYAGRKLGEVTPLIDKLKRELTIARKRNMEHKKYWEDVAAKHAKEQRYALYLELKKEFENEPGPKCLCNAIVISREPTVTDPSSTNRH